MEWFAHMGQIGYSLAYSPNKELFFSHEPPNREWLVTLVCKTDQLHDSRCSSVDINWGYQWK